MKVNLPEVRVQVTIVIIIIISSSNFTVVISNFIIINFKLLINCIFIKTYQRSASTVHVTLTILYC